MADFAAPGGAHAAGFADAERREIVVQKKALRLHAAAVGIDVLRFLDRRQGRERERLCFAAMENGGTSLVTTAPAATSRQLRTC